MSRLPPVALQKWMPKSSGKHTALSVSTQSQFSASCNKEKVQDLLLTEAHRVIETGESQNMQTGLAKKRAAPLRM